MDETIAGLEKKQTDTDHAISRTQDILNETAGNNNKVSENYNDRKDNKIDKLNTILMNIGDASAKRNLNREEYDYEYDYADDYSETEEEDEHVIHDEKNHENDDEESDDNKPEYHYYYYYDNLVPGIEIVHDLSNSEIDEVLPTPICLVSKDSEHSDDSMDSSNNMNSKDNLNNDDIKRTIWYKKDVKKIM